MALGTDQLGSVVAYVVGGHTPEKWVQDHQNAPVTLGEVRAVFEEVRADMAANPGVEWDTPAEQPTPGD